MPVAPCLRNPLTAAILLLVGLMSGVAGGSVYAQDEPAIAHSFFVAGPSFTGIIDEQGEPVWQAPRNGARDGFVLDNGHILIAWANEVVEFDNERQPVWRYALDASNREIGTACRLPNGNTLITELGANPRLMEVTPTGELAVNFALQPETDNAHMQTRMARKLANGNYLVPHLLAFAVKEYTPQGEVVNVIHTDTEAYGGRETECWPFTAIRTEQGTTIIGCTHGNRVVEVDADGQIIWQITNEDVGGIIHDACGVQRLPNGNTVIACYGARDGVKLFEVNAEREIVWTYEGPHRVHHFQVLTTNGEPIDGPVLK